MTNRKNAGKSVETTRALQREIIGPVTRGRLTAILAERVMGWTPGPNRFLTANRGWLRCGAFQPTERLQDAHRVLLAANPSDYTFGGGIRKPAWAYVQIGDASRQATDESLPIAICLATLRALGIDIEVCD